MKLKSLFFYFIIFLTLPLSEARADVLFIDVNNSPKEIEAAKKAAEKSGRKLVVVPDVDPETRAKIGALQLETEKIQDQKIRVCTKSGRNTPDCLKITEKFNNIRDQLEVLQGENRISSSLIEEEISKRAKENKPFSTIIISGHDGTGEFSGTFGEITDQEISTLVAKYPTQANSLRSLHLWGCYTTSPGSLLNNWLHYFPHLSLVSGYDDQAPLNDKPYGWKYLAGVLEKEDELMQATDAKKLQKLLKKIPGASQTHAAIYACGSYASNGDYYELADLALKCDNFISEVKRLADPYLCFKSAKETGCENPPDQTSQGPVREFYEALHKADACRNLEIGDWDNMDYNRDEVLRLIFYKEVKANFARIYGSQLEEMDKYMEKMGVDPKARFKNVGEMSRKEMMEAMEALGKYLQTKTGREFALDERNKAGQIKSNPKDISPEIQPLVALHRSISRTLVNLNSFCVPFNWIEKNATDKTRCVPENGFFADDEIDTTPIIPNPIVPRLDPRE